MSDSSTLALLHLDGDLTNSGVSPAKFTVENGSPKFVDNPKFGTKCLQFDGRSSIACPYGAGGITLGNQFTIDFWAKHSGDVRSRCFFSIGTTNGDDQTIAFYTSSANNTLLAFEHHRESAKRFYYSQDNSWHHYAITCDNGKFTLYYDGTAKGSCNIDLDFKDNYFLRFGGSLTYGGNYWFNGYMDEIRISNCVRYTSDFTPEGGHTQPWL